MNYRQMTGTNLKPSILGFGTMRMPVIDGVYGNIDEEKAIKMIRYALDNGINYIDTAYPYHEKNSEIVVGKALKDGYREKAILVTKNPVWLVKEYDDFEKYLDEQLEKMGVEYFDIYLFHALGKDRWKNIKDLGALKFMDEMKAKGKIKAAGFSIHDDFSLYKELIDTYKWDMSMIQMNYMDVDQQTTVEAFKYAGDRGVSVVVMEPLRGGQLANLPESITNIFNESEYDCSIVERSFRWIANRPEVKVVLSGMSTLNQMIENIEIAERLNENVLDDKELAIYTKVKDTLESRVKVPCTECKYCMPCPHGVNIPRNFVQYNKASIYEDVEGPAYVYQHKFKEEERASKCIECGECEPKCPQAIKIIDELKNVDKVLGATMDFDDSHWTR